MSLSMYWPILLIVGANTMFNISAKSVNPKINPFASLVISYSISAVICLVLLVCTGQGVSLSAELHKINYATFTLALAIPFLEFGHILMYKFKWDISVGALVAHILCAIALVIVGILVYGEVITIRKAIGFVLCLAGLILINRKSKNKTNA